MLMRRLSIMTKDMRLKLPAKAGRPAGRPRSIPAGFVPRERDVAR